MSFYETGPQLLQGRTESLSCVELNAFSLMKASISELDHQRCLSDTGPAVVSGCHVILPTMGLRSLQDLCSHRIPKHLAQCLADGKPFLPHLNRKEGREGGKEEGRKSRRERGMEGPIHLF